MPSPTIARRSGSIPSLRMPTTIVDARTAQRAKTTAPPVTSKRRPGSIPNSRPHSKRLGSSFEPTYTFRFAATPHNCRLRGSRPAKGKTLRIPSPARLCQLLLRRLHLLEISRIRRRLVLLGGHQEPIAAEEIRVRSDDHIVVA